MPWARWSSRRSNATKSLDHKKLADFLRTNEMMTIVGPIVFGPDGERKESATLMAQFRGVVDKNIEQFREPGQADHPVPREVEDRRAHPAVREGAEVAAPTAE